MNKLDIQTYVRNNQDTIYRLWKYKKVFKRQSSVKRKAFGAGVASGILLGITIIAYAITSLFFTKSETSKLSKKTVVQFDLTTDMSSGEVDPG